MATNPGTTNPYDPDRLKTIPKVYGDTPSFLGVPVSKEGSELNAYDAAILGVPWEGPVTWGDLRGSGCEQVPKLLRQEAARYGSFLPELDIDIFEFLKVTDFGDARVNPGSIEETLAEVEKKASAVFNRGLFLLAYGGDHSFLPEIVGPLGKSSSGRVGLIIFDSHFDNLESFNGEAFARCCPVNRLAALPGIKTDSIVHFGIRGPRNTRSGADFAREIGATTMTIREVRSIGFDEALRQAVRIAKEGTERFYVSVCSDAVDPAYNPAGPPDPAGLSSYEILTAAHETGLHGASGFDFVEIYPYQANSVFSMHMAIWAGMYALAGVAQKKARLTNG